MLSYISTKFEKPQENHSHEPRAALFLNRFTRTLTIMYATNGLEKVLGISADDLINKSFYYCIQENCLQEAVRCLESAKANDSIAYLRFWFRNPVQDDHGGDDDESMGDANSTDQDDDGGVDINSEMDMDSSDGAAITTGSESASRTSAEPHNQQANGHLDPNSRSTSGNSTDLDGAIFDRQPEARSSTSSLPLSPHRRTSGGRLPNPPRAPIELEAVVSCTSDGLVVILRGAKPFVPPVTPAHGVSSHRAAHPYRNGLFASPWAADPIIPQGVPHNAWLPNYNPPPPEAAAPNFSYPVPQQPSHASLGPQPTDFLQTIRDVAAFAWSLTGINGSLVRYSRGTPAGESQPPSGFPIWEPKRGEEPSNGYHEYNGGSRMTNGYGNGVGSTNGGYHGTNGGTNGRRY